MPDTDRRMDRFDWLTLIALAVTAGAMLTSMSLRQVDLAAWQDDAVYLATAKAIADGHGYRHDWLPGAPWQTKYPPAYPYLLSVLWRGADLVARPLLLQGANVLMLLGAHWLAYRTMRRWWGLAWVIAASGTVLSMCNFFWFQLCASAMSEPMYALASSACVALVTKVAKRSSVPGTVNWPWGLVLGAGAAAALAVLTRSIGVSMAGGVVAALLLKRRYGASAWVLGLTLAGGAAWALWRAHLSGLNAAIPQTGVLEYELDYSHWLAKGPGDLIRVFTLNISALLYSLLFMIRPLPGAFIGWALSSGPVTSTLMIAAIVLVSWLVFEGFRRTYKSGDGVAHMSIAIQVLMVLSWPFHPVRFMVPLSLWLIPMALVGATATFAPMGRGGRRVLELLPRQWMGLAPVLVIFALPSPRQQLGTLWFGPDPDLTAPREKLFDMVRALTPPDAVVAAPGGALLYLRTGRRSLLPLRNDDPVAWSYHEDRSPVDLGIELFSTPAKLKEFQRQIEALGRYYGAAGVRYLAYPIGGGDADKLFADYRSQHPEMFREIDRTDTFWLFAVNPPSP